MCAGFFIGNFLGFWHAYYKGVDNGGAGGAEAPPDFQH
jgi:hypothetical protein